MEIDPEGLQAKIADTDAAMTVQDAFMFALVRAMTPQQRAAFVPILREELETARTYFLHSMASDQMLEALELRAAEKLHAIERFGQPPGPSTPREG